MKNLFHRTRYFLLSIIFSIHEIMKIIIFTVKLIETGVARKFEMV